MAKTDNWQPPAYGKSTDYTHCRAKNRRYVLCGDKHPIWIAISVEQVNCPECLEKMSNG